MPSRLGSDTFVVKRAVWVQDPRGGELRQDWENATETTVTDASVQPFITSEKLEREKNQERAFSVSARRFFCPPGTDVLYTDRLIFDGEEYDVLGHPGVWRNLRGEEDHVAFIAQRREG